VNWLDQFGVEGNFSQIAGRETEQPIIGRDYPKNFGKDISPDVPMQEVLETFPSERFLV
jgi:hypothetical protein